MFYAEISKDLKQLASVLASAVLQGESVDQEDAVLVELAPYIIGFIGVHVDLPVTQFQHGIDERKWFLSDVSSMGWVFEGVDKDEDEVDRVMVVPKERGIVLRFMFRDPEAGSAVEFPVGKRPSKRMGRTTGSPVKKEEERREESAESPPAFYPGSYRDGE